MKSLKEDAAKPENYSAKSASKSDKSKPTVLNQQSVKSPEIDMKDLKEFEAQFVDKHAEEDDDEEDDGKKKKTTNLASKNAEEKQSTEELDSDKSQMGQEK